MRNRINLERITEKLDNKYYPSICRAIIEGMRNDLRDTRKDVDQLKEALSYALDEMICPMCVRLNPQHKDCTSCDDIEYLRKALKETD